MIWNVSFSRFSVDLFSQDVSNLGQHPMKMVGPEAWIDLDLVKFLGVASSKKSSLVVFSPRTKNMRKSNWIVSRLGVKMTKILETTTYNPTHQQLWGYRSRWFAAPIFNSARSICKKNLRILPNVFWSILKRFKTHSNVLETSWQCDDSFSITSCDTFKFPLKSWRSKTKNFNQKSSGNLSPPNIPSHRGSHKRCCHRCVALHRRRGGWHRWGIGHGGCHGLSGLDSHALALLAAFLSHGFQKEKGRETPTFNEKKWPLPLFQEIMSFFQYIGFEVKISRSYQVGLTVVGCFARMQWLQGERWKSLRYPLLKPYSWFT